MHFNTLGHVLYYHQAGAIGSHQKPQKQYTTIPGRGTSPAPGQRKGAVFEKTFNLACYLVPIHLAALILTSTRESM